jgi:hypothetical protein
MATPGKATLKEMTAKGDEMTGGKELEVQFNPESL